MSKNAQLEQRRVAEGYLISRRHVMTAPLFSAMLLGAQPAPDVRLPLRIGHRAASMKMVGDFGVFRMARQIAGLDGVELQVAQGDPNLWNLDAVRRYKAEANRWGLHIPSLAGIWGRNVSILSRIHSTIRVTPAMEAGITDHV